MRVGFLVLAVLLNAGFAGCLAGKAGVGSEDGHDLHAEDVALPVLELEMTIGNQTYRFTTAVAAPEVNASEEIDDANETANNTTSNPPASNETGNATSSADNGTVSGSNEPSGVAPVNVSYQISIKPEPAAGFAWEFDFGEPIPDAGVAGNGSTNGTASNGTAEGNGTANPGNATTNGTADGNATQAGIALGNTSVASLNYTYKTTGNFTPKLTVTLANGTTLDLMATLSVLAPVTAAANNTTSAAPKLPDPITLTGTISGVDGLPAKVDRTFALNVSVSTMTLTLTFASPYDIDWDITGPKGETHKGDEFGAEAPKTFTAPGEGTWKVTLTPFIAANTSYTIRVTFT
jgi:hypothetical protein